MDWHTEILTKKQLAVLRQVGPFLTQKGYYLAGGTAVALQLGHRRYKKKYDLQDTVHLLCSLSYFDDADVQLSPRLFWKTNWKEIRSTIRGWVESLTDL